MRVLLTGASGFLGRRLAAALGRRRHEVLRLGRGPAAPGDPRLLSWDPERPKLEAARLEGLEAVIHLAGEPIARRFSEAHKRKVRDSRVLGTRALLQALGEARCRPALFLSASAVGYYGAGRGDEELDENSRSGSDFLAEVCAAWEKEAAGAAALGARSACARLGIVLGREGGALKSMLPAFRLGLGGRLGSGRQWMSWISADDAVRALLFLLEREDSAGAYNLTAPNPCTNAQFAAGLGRALGRPARLPVPAFALKALLGEMAEALLLGGQRALPGRLQKAGFKWETPFLGEALNKIFPS